jgi:hypothetical protein
MAMITPKRLGKELRFNPFEVPLVQEQLGVILSQYYVDVEKGDFFQKYNIRFYISAVVRYLWKLPKHREAFKKSFGFVFRFFLLWRIRLLK